MNGRQLIALFNDRTVGVVTRDRNGRFKFAYEETWRSAEGAYPLSLSMPLTAAEHGHRYIEAFLWGLLPDNAQVLDRWARRFQVSPRNPFALISYVGEDCAGAVQFIRPDRLNEVTGHGPPAIEWLNEDDVAKRLRTLRADHAAWRSPSDTGQFSLAGAQPKTALLFENGRWGVPSGRTPTTHILKPPTGEFDGHAENEHVCLRLASELGLITANSAVMHFKDEVAIVIERYDRQRTDGRILRVHQEDLCQALAILPTSKYENEGGPGIKASVELIRTVSTNAPMDVQNFVDAIAFNWIIGGTDAHAKNYSLLIGAEGRARLAPLYDIASILPYDFDFQRIRLAMKIGGKYRLRDIGLRQWHNLAGELRLDRDQITRRIHDLAVNLLDVLPTVTNEAKKDGLDHPLIEKLSSRLEERARHCISLLRG
ncbi:MAG TPA: type II toxin-antitoxin system HipA family toxin [Pseudolabrys sp.]|nr:type II toxin-antitoxin system HipA family toxin [Pseudolabrys sp.]